MAGLITELIVEVAKDFQVHLEADNNKRILFSGKFGKGKTTFLEEFFSNQSKYMGEYKYRYIYLDPVHYSIANNEDIFRYIKYDILLSILNLNVDFDDIEFTLQETASYYIWKHPEEAIKPLLEFVPKVGKAISDILPKVEELYSKIKTFQKEVNSRSESAQILNFFTEIHVDPKSIYESDTITHIIQNFLVKEKANDKKGNVLIIDNLDRIDPEHIFRILNIFSAHMDFHKPNGNENKFGFDKIILVCDLLNIRNIFKNRYGRDVDFEGYINKFYSIDTFYFQNYNQIDNIVKSLVFNASIRANGYGVIRLGDFIGRSDFGILKIISALVFNNIITLRQIFNITSTPLYFSKTTVKFKGDFVDIIEESPLIEIKFLAKVLGGYIHLHEAIADLSSNGFHMKDIEYYFNRLLYFDTKPLHNHAKDGSLNVPIQHRSTITYRIILNHREKTISSIYQIEPSGSSINPYEPTEADFYNLYIKIINDAYNEKIID